MRATRNQHLAHFKAKVKANFLSFLNIATHQRWLVFILRLPNAYALSCQTFSAATIHFVIVWCDFFVQLVLFQNSFYIYFFNGTVFALEFIIICFGCRGFLSNYARSGDTKWAPNNNNNNNINQNKHTHTHLPNQFFFSIRYSVCRVRFSLR